MPTLVVGMQNDAQKHAHDKRGHGTRCALAMKSLLLVFLSLSLPAVALAEEPEILVEMSRQEVFEGESVLYRVTLNHVENPSPPNLDGFDNFDVAPAGDRTLDMQRTVIINGRRSDMVRRGHQYDYRLTPRRAGSLTIPGPTAEVDGRTLTGPEQTLRVREPDDQDVVILKIAADCSEVYPMQPFTVTLSVQIKELPEPYSKENPLALRGISPPALNIPWVVDDQLPDGLEPEVGWQDWLLPMQSSKSGFSINKLGRSPVFSLFENRPMTFEPSMRKVSLRDEDGTEVGYRRFEFPRSFMSKRIGRHEFGPVTVEGTFVTGADARREMTGERIYAVARPIEVTVKDVPIEGRPSEYTGAIGRFVLSGDLEPKTAKVGDPMTLTLTLNGNGTLGSTFAPDLSGVPEIARRFKVYEATEETTDGLCRFTYALRPLAIGAEPFPPVPLAYFDVGQERYVTLNTDPIPITITETDRLTADQIVSTPGTTAAGQKELEASREGIFVNVTDLSEVRDESVRPIRWLAGLASLVALYLAVAIVAVRFQRLTGDKALARRRAAPGRARRRLREARAALDAGHVGPGIEAAEAALVGLVADAADLPEAGLTPKDVRRKLEELGAPDDLVERVGEFLDACDAGRYGAAGQAGGGIGRRAGKLLSQTIDALNSQRRFR